MSTSQQQNNSKEVIKYYLDAEKKHPAPTDENGNLLLNFETVLQGQTKKIRLYAENMISYPMQLEPILERGEPDLKITQYPPILKVGEIAPVDITFSPSLDRLKPLNSSFDFRKIILSRI